MENLDPHRKPNQGRVLPTETTSPDPQHPWAALPRPLPGYAPDPGHRSLPLGVSKDNANGIKGIGVAPIGIENHCPVIELFPENEMAMGL